MIRLPRLLSSLTGWPHKLIADLELANQASNNDRDGTLDFSADQLASFDILLEQRATPDDFRVTLQHIAASMSANETMVSSSVPSPPPSTLFPPPAAVPALQLALIANVSDHAIRLVWAHALRTVFFNCWAINFAPTFIVNEHTILSYRGQARETKSLLDSGYLDSLHADMQAKVDTTDETADRTIADNFNTIAFQLVWSFAALGRCGLLAHVADSAEHDAMLQDAIIQYGRQDFDVACCDDHAIFVPTPTLHAATTGAFFVPVRTAFVVLCNTPKSLSWFSSQEFHGGSGVDGGDSVVGGGDGDVGGGDSGGGGGENVSVATLYIEPAPMTAAAADPEVSSSDSFLSDMSLRMLEVFFPDAGQVAPNNERYANIHALLVQLVACREPGSSSAAAVFIDSPFAQSFWRPFEESVRADIILRLEGEEAPPVIVFPNPIYQEYQGGLIAPVTKARNAAYARSASTIAWRGFPNINNNCFLNSVLFMLMCTGSNYNTFVDAVCDYADEFGLLGEDQVERDTQLIATIDRKIDDLRERERFRMAIARRFSHTLVTAFSISNGSPIEREELAEADDNIYRLCETLLPLLDMWCKVYSGNYLIAHAGEFQDVSECMQYLCELLCFETHVVSKLTFSEEFRTLPFSKVEEEQYGVRELAQRSIAERQNPIGVRTRCSEQWGILAPSIDWTAHTAREPIDLQAALNAANIECSIVPAPLTTAQKAAVPKPEPCTRMLVTRNVWSSGARMMIICVQRRPWPGMIYRNPLQFGAADGCLTIGEQSMRIGALTLWQRGHYTSLVYHSQAIDNNAEDSETPMVGWYHYNDIQPAGHRFEFFGVDLEAAVAVIDRRRLLVTSLCCVRQQCLTDDQVLSHAFSLEIQKRATVAGNRMDGKIILLRKDEQYPSPLLAAERAGTRVELPRNYLYGRDDPNRDFFFDASWYAVDGNGEPVPFRSYQNPFSILLGAGISLPKSQRNRAVFSGMPIYDVLGDSSVQRMSQDCAQQCIAAARRIDNVAERLNDTAINLSLATFLMRLCAMNPRQFVDANTSRGVSFDHPTASRTFALDTFFYTLLCRSADAVRGYTRRKSDGKEVNLLNYERLIIPIHLAEIDHWALVCVEPAKRHITYYDSLAYNGRSCCSRILAFLVENPAERLLWSTDNIFALPIQAHDDSVSCGVYVLQFAATLMDITVATPITFTPLSDEELAQLREYFATLLIDFGHLGDGGL